MTFIDDFTRYNFVYLLSAKSEAFKAFLHFQRWVESNSGFKILKLKSDRGGEYSSTEFLTHLRDLAIDIKRGPANRPTANSVSERFNRTLIGRLRTQFEQSGLPLFLWGELVMYSALQINLSPSVAIDLATPYSLFTPHLTGHHHPLKPARFRPFGCLGYVLDVHASKLKPVAQRMFFVGLEPGSNAYRFWDTVHSKVVVSVDAKFDESTFPARGDRLSPSASVVASTFDYDALRIFPDQIPPPTDNVNAATMDLVVDIPLAVEDEQHTAIPTPADHTLDPQSTCAVSPAPHDEESDPLDLPTHSTRQSTRTRTVPRRYGFLASDAEGSTSDNPSYDEALAGPDRAHWVAAMTAEWESFCQHNVGTLVDSPEGANVLGGMWVLSRPRDEHHRIVKYKARYVIFGNHQVHGLDFTDTYASVGRSDSMRILLALSMSYGWLV